jgi:hypothetical protein
MKIDAVQRGSTGKGDGLEQRVSLRTVADV